MFSSTQFDKIKRGVQKYRNSPDNVQSLRTPLYICITLLLIICAFCIYFTIILHSNTSQITTSESNTSTQPQKHIQSEEVERLKNRFLEQLKYSHHNPETAMLDKIEIPENRLFTRTKSVQYLYDYVEASTREYFRSQYAQDPNFHHLKCVETFDHKTKAKLPKFQVGVKAFLSNEVALYSQSIAQSYVKRETIKEINNGGLSPLVGQFGIVAKKDIDKYTCMGHYYGDEYLLKEYESQFPWDVYGTKEDHPWRLKWDYYMTVPYYSFADRRLDLENLNVTMTMDAYHSYDYEKYVDEGGQDLTNEEGRMKENLEVFVNDARKDLYKEDLGSGDLRRKNCEFIYCSVDGVLQTFLVATRDIKEGEQLFVYYGPNYG